MKCPNCHHNIDNKKRDESGKIKCAKCHKTFRIRSKKNSKGKAISKTPKGAWLKKSKGEIQIGISTKNSRSRISLILASFSLISTTAVFVYLELYNDFGFSAILQSLWALLIVISFWAYAIMANYGQIIFNITRKKGEMFIGYKSIGITKKFNWNEINEVKEVALKKDDLISKFYPVEYTIILSGYRKEVSCKMALMDQQRKFLLEMLEKILSQLKASTANKSK